MDPSTILQIVEILVLLSLSAYFSSAETALTTVNPHSIRAMAEDGNKKAETVLKLIENPSQMLSSILVGNNLVNISLTSLTTTIAIRVFGSMGAGIATAVITVLVLIFGEITPKTYATINNTKIALSYASSIYFVTKVLTPVVYIINKLSTGILMIFHIDSKQSKRIMTERELRTIVDVSHEDGVIEEAEKDVLRKPFFTYETQKVSSLLAQMREKSVSFSIVLDEYGVTAGLITLEDIVEEIFGELRDEYDESEEDTFKQLPDGSYMVSASLKLDDLDDLLDVDLDSEDYYSLGGYIIELLDHLPSEGEIAQDDNFTFKVVYVSKNRMETIHIIPKKKTDSDH